MARTLVARRLTARQLRGATALGVIDNFALALIHALLAVTAWRLLARPDLDDDAAARPDEPASDG